MQTSKGVVFMTELDVPDEPELPDEPAPAAPAPPPAPEDERRSFVVTAKNGTIVREGCELTSPRITSLPRGTEVTGGTVAVAFSGAERVRLFSPVEGWVSLKTLGDQGLGFTK